MRELGIGFVAYSPLGRGFLTGQIRSPDDLPADDYRRNHPRFMGEAFEQNLALVRGGERLRGREELHARADRARLGAGGGNRRRPIPGTKRRSYLEENLGALDAMLTADDRARLNVIMPIGVAAGERYADMRSIDR